MFDSDSPRIYQFLAGLLLGAVIGATTATLLAPQSGRRTRKQLMRTLEGARESAGDRWDDVARDVRSAVEAGKRRLPI